MKAEEVFDERLEDSLDLLNRLSYNEEFEDQAKDAGLEVLP